MSSAVRVQNGRYTEADVLALYIKYREARIGPFTREVGDFIAHNKRDRGATLDATVYLFAQFAFFQTYQGIRKQPLKPKGDCGWWLRHYLLTKTKEAEENDLRRSVGLTKKEAKNAVKSWFPGESVYPTTIKCSDPQLLHGMAQMFSQTLVSNNVFNLDQAKAELSKIFKSEGIDQKEIERFLVGTSVLLRGKSVEIVPGLTANVILTVGNTRYIPVDENGKETDDNESTFLRLLPDGNLKISVSTDNQTGDGLVGIGFDFLDTGIDTESYFSRSLVSFDEPRIPRLQLDQHFSFDTGTSPPISC